MLEELMKARLSDIQVAETRINKRMEWEQMFQVERLERALTVARGKLNILPTLSAKVN